MTEDQKNIDFLAEVIASHLVANKMIDDSDIYVHLLGVFKRFFSRDIEKIDIRKNEAGENEWNLFLHREGFYDLLPEGFFHTQSRKYFKDRRETLEEFRLHRIEEKNARNFFMPLEQEFFKHLIHKEIFEQNFYFAPETIQEFIDFFNLSHVNLNMYQKASLFFILPYTSLISGNLSLTETCFEIILQETVRIKILHNSSIKAGNLNIPRLGRNTLGKDSLLGSDFLDFSPQLLIEIGPLSDSELLLDYLSGMNRKLIDWLTGLFVQADLSTHVIILLKKQDEVFVLGGKNHESRLNYSTSI